MKFLGKAILVLLILATGAVGMWFWQQKKREPKADLSGLRAQLDAAAERNFLLPSLGVQKVEMNVPDEKVPSAIAATIQMAEKLGGTAMQGLDRDQAKVVMITLPKNRLEKLITALQKNSASSNTLEKLPPGTEMADCEVIVHPQGK